MRFVGILWNVKVHVTCHKTKQKTLYLKVKKKVTFFIPGKTVSRISCLKVFCKNEDLENLAKFTGKHRCQSLLFNKAVD